MNCKLIIPSIDYYIFISEINKKAEIMIEIIKENTIRTLTEEEINRLIIKSANSYHHFSKEEFSTSNFPLLSVR